jgi:putative nucleotidyltransferase with HDIG domain
MPNTAEQAAQAALAAGDSRRFQRRGATSGHRLVAAINALEQLPALAHSHARLLELLAEERPSVEEIVLTIESDIGLVTAVLRAGERAARRGQAPGVNVPECVRLLGGELERVVRRLPVFDFFDRSSVVAAEAGRLRIHALATQHAAERVGHELRLPASPLVSLAALFHDIGKIALSLAWADYGAVARAPLSPDARAVRERETFGVDHAIAGAVLIRRLGLPPALAAIVEHHHSPHAQGDAALIRVADMLAHYEAGDQVDASELTRAAKTVGIDNAALRKLLYESPRFAVARRRHLDPCPLSQRQLEMLQLLAEGKPYKQIATDLDLSTSTVRSHIYAAYRKLGVNDRAQAVLLATDRGWL